MSSTISGFASVVTSPTSAKFEMPAITRRMILPERVFGMSATIQTFFGRAILPISVSIAVVTLSAISSLLGRDAGLERDVHLDRAAAELVDDRNGGRLGDLLDGDRRRLELLGARAGARRR